MAPVKLLCCCSGSNYCCSCIHLRSSSVVTYSRLQCFGSNSIHIGNGSGDGNGLLGVDFFGNSWGDHAGESKPRNANISTTNDIIDLCSGYDFNCAVDSNGDVFCWGSSVFYSGYFFQ